MHADLVFTGGSVHLGNAVRSRATAVAVTGERIVAVGHDDVSELVGPRTEVVDLAGRLLIPGFQDAHVHPVGGGVELGACDLTGVVGRRGVPRAASRRTPRPTPRRAWITGGGWSMESFPGGTPDRAFLDELVPDRPVFLPNRDHHGAWVNTRALEIAGIDARHPRPRRRPDRARRGRRPRPACCRRARWSWWPRTCPARHRGRARSRACCAPRRSCTRSASPAWQDAAVGADGGRSATWPAPTGPPGPRTCSPPGSSARCGGTATRVWSRSTELLASREELTGGLMSATTVKIMQDGVAENHTAAMLSPYLRQAAAAPPAAPTPGSSFVDPAALRDYVTVLDAHGFQVHFHALGDRAVREALDAIEAARTRQRLQRQPPSPGAPPGRPPRRRPALPRARRDRQHAAAVGRARAADGRADDPVPRTGAVVVAVPVRRPPPSGRHAVGWQRLAGQQRRTRSRASTSRSTGSPPAATRRSFYPEQRLDLASALAAYTVGHGVREPPRRHRAPSPSATSPTSSCSTVTRSLRPTAEICHTRVEQTFVGGGRVYAAAG